MSGFDTVELTGAVFIVWLLWLLLGAAVLFLGWCRFKRRRWALLATCVFSFNPIFWVFEGVYIRKRWGELQQEEPDDVFSRHPLLWAASPILLMALFLSLSLLGFQLVSDGASTERVTHLDRGYSYTPPRGWILDKAESKREDTDYFVDATRAAHLVVGFDSVSSDRGAYFLDFSSEWKGLYPDSQIGIPESVESNHLWTRVRMRFVGKGIHYLFFAYWYSTPRGTYFVWFFFPEQTGGWGGKTADGFIKGFRFY